MELHGVFINSFFIKFVLFMSMSDSFSQCYSINYSKKLEKHVSTSIYSNEEYKLNHS